MIDQPATVVPVLALPRNAIRRNLEQKSSMYKFSNIHACTAPGPQRHPHDTHETDIRNL
jgi:hypothetical protein